MVRVVFCYGCLDDPFLQPPLTNNFSAGPFFAKRPTMPFATICIHAKKCYGFSSAGVLWPLVYTVEKLFNEYLLDLLLLD